MFRLDHEPPAQPLRRLVFPDRPDQIAEWRIVDDLPAVRGRVERFGVVRRRLVVHARTLAALGARLASRRARSGMSFSALAPATSARPLAESPRTASV